MPQIKPEFQTMSREQFQAHLVGLAKADPQFREALVRDPKVAVEGETGLHIPTQMKVTVLEESADRICLVLPAAAGELSDLELEAVAGGCQQLSSTCYMG